jgi:hypothetical protein
MVGEAPPRPSRFSRFGLNGPGPRAAVSAAGSLAYGSLQVPSSLVKLYAQLPDLLRDNSAFVGRVVRWAASEWDTLTLPAHGCPYLAHGAAVAYSGHIGSTMVWCASARNWDDGGRWLGVMTG